MADPQLPSALSLIRAADRAAVDDPDAESDGHAHLQRGERGIRAPVPMRLGVHPTAGRVLASVLGALAFHAGHFHTGSLSRPPALPRVHALHDLLAISGRCRARSGHRERAALPGR